MRQDGDTIVYRDNDEQLKQLSPKERDAIKKKVNVSTSRYSCDQKKKYPRFYCNNIQYSIPDRAFQLLRRKGAGPVYQHERLKEEVGLRI
jgi:hypothetical protein